MHILNGRCPMIFFKHPALAHLIGQKRHFKRLITHFKHAWDDFFVLDLPLLFDCDLFRIASIPGLVVKLYCKAIMLQGNMKTRLPLNSTPLCLSKPLGER
jgi:hypothetical protein